MSDSQKKREGKLIIVSGPSGVGKGTIIRKVRRSGEFPLVPSVSVTTRPKRPMEREGVDYHYMSREDFIQRRKNGEFLESFEVYPGGAWYGTLAAPVRESLERGEWVLLEIDVKGAEEVLKTYPDAVTVFIEPPALKDLETRLRHRGTETEEALAKRLAQAEEEIRRAKDYRYRVVNDNLDKAVDEFVGILRGSTPLC